MPDQQQAAKGGREKTRNCRWSITATSSRLSRIMDESFMMLINRNTCFQWIFSSQSSYKKANIKLHDISLIHKYKLKNNTADIGNTYLIKVSQVQSIKIKVSCMAQYEQEGNNHHWIISLFVTIIFFSSFFRQITFTLNVKRAPCRERLKRSE